MSRVLRILECVSLDISKPIFFSGLQHSRDRTLPTVWPSMLSYLPTASSPQFGRAEYPQICVSYCEVRSVRIRFSLLQWLLVTKVNFLFNVSVGDIHISEVLVNFTVYTSGYPRKTLAGIKTDSVFFRIAISFALLSCSEISCPLPISCTYIILERKELLRELLYSLFNKLSLYVFQTLPSWNLGILFCLIKPWYLQIKALFSRL